MKGIVLALILLTSTLIGLADPRQWNHAGLPLRQGNHLDWSQRAVAQDASGNTLVFWSDARNGSREVYAQLISPNGTQLWAQGGISVTAQAPGRHEYSTAVAVNGGWIVAWIDYRYDVNGDVFAQKFSDAGSRLWNPTGALVDTFTCYTPDCGCGVDMTSLRAVDDGSGGAIIAWDDNRRDYGDVFAQRVLSSGSVAWNGPLRVTYVDGRQNGMSSAGDGSGNMLVAWEDQRDQANVNIYAAKITPSGQLPWGGENGMLVCGATYAQYSPDVCFEGSGGCCVVWTDQRGESDDLYMQRINSSGEVQWTVDGIPLCNATHNQGGVRVATSMNGTTADGFVAVWEDTRVNGERAEVYAQKVNAQGVAQWTANGLFVCGNAGQDSLGPTGQTRGDVRLASDLAGGLVCAWEDWRNSNNDYQNCDLYAGRVLANGTLSWNGKCGNVVSDGPLGQYFPVVTVNSNGALIFDNDLRNGSQSLRLQELALASGTRLLPDTGVVMLPGLDGDANRPRAIPMTTGRTAIVWEDNRLVSGGTVLFYQIIASDGQIEKPANGARLVPDDGGSSVIDQQRVRLCSDAGNGFFATFEDLRTGASRIRLIRVNSAGNIASNPAGEPVWGDAQTTDQVDAFCSPDGQGGCYVAWSNYDLNYYIDAYVMRFDANLQRIWQQPVRLTNTTDDDLINGLVSAPDGCAIVVWQSGPYGNFDMRVAKVCGDGSVLYNFAVCDAPHEQTEPAMIADGQGGVYIAWSDERNLTTRPGLDKDIYGQHVSATGQEMWGHNGIPVVSDTLWQGKPTLALSGGNVFCVWQGYHAADSSLSLYAQKLTSEGARLWPDSGLVVCDAPGDQSEQVILPDNSYFGIYVAWTDLRGPIWPQVYATHLGPDGQPIHDFYWALHRGGQLSNPTQQWQYAPALASDGTGGFVTAWVDQRSSGEDPLRDIYAQHCVDIDFAGQPSNGLPSRYALSQNYPNPFNPTTQISFALPKSGMTTLKVYDLLGRHVTTLVNRVMPAGNHTASYDASRLASGIYFYRLESGSFSSTRKMILLK